MTDLAIRVRENNRRIVRGVSYDDRIARYRVQIAEGETVVLQLNMADWLGSATVSSSALSNDGVTVAKTEASGVFTLTASGIDTFGDCDLTITASDGRVRLERFRFESPISGYYRDGYGSEA